MAFIVFEGGEAVGKSTQLQLLIDWLRVGGISCRKTHEPGGTPFAEDIRGLFKAVSRHGDDPTPLTDLMLVMAARAQHMAKVIRPSLARGEWVVCDRFLDSSYVYQGICGGVPKDYIDAVAAGIIGDLVPDLTLVLAMPVAASRRRLLSRAEATGTSLDADRMDGYGTSFHEQISLAFEQLVQEEIPYPHQARPKRVLVDASGSVESIHASVCDILRKELGLGF